MNLNRRQFLKATAASLTAGASGALIAEGSASSSSVRLPVEGQLPPLEHAIHWLNSIPLDVASLRGKVVLINFWTYTCINSLRTLPYVRAWAAKYSHQGLVVIGVHTPEFAFEHALDNVCMAVKELKVEFPVAVDSNAAIWRAFKNEYWPAFYFVDAKGRIRHHQFGEGEYELSETVLQELLRDANGSGIGHELVTADARGVEAAPDWSSLRSPETYIGAALAQNFSGSRKGGSYVIPPQLHLNHWALEGDWTRAEQAAVLNASDGGVAYRFHARDLHVVMAPPASGHSVRFRVSLDGHRPGPDHGTDVDSEGCGTLSEPRLYQLIRQSQPVTDRQFKIEFLDAGAQVFDFTFG